MKKEISLLVGLIVLVTIFTNALGYYIYDSEDPDQFPPKPQYIESTVGSHIVFDCPLVFPHNMEIPYVIYWKKDNQTIFSSYNGELFTSPLYVGRLRLIDTDPQFGKASINLTSIRESDAGWYLCDLEFPNRTPSSRENGSWFHLAIEGNSLIKVPPVNLTVMESDNAFFHCVTKNAIDISVTWYKDGTDIYELTDLASRMYISPDGSLSITPTVMGDIGWYECRVSNGADEQSVKAFLNVQYKAKVIYTPTDIYLVYGKPAILNCHFRANPPLTNLRWDKDGFLFDAYNVQGVFFKSNGSLYFSNATEDLAGRYSCMPFNRLGSAGPSKLMNVYVQHPPVFSQRPDPIYFRRINQTVTMSCAAKNIVNTKTTPKVIWSRKDGAPFPIGRYDIDGGNLTIDNIQKSDRGVYQCSATNEAATVIEYTELILANVEPLSPYNLTANSTDVAITLKWEPGYIRHQMVYTVWYRATTSMEWRTKDILGIQQYDVTIDGLEPGNEYEFMVLSKDAFGDGIFSKSFKYRTKPRDYLQPEEYRNTYPSYSQIGPPKNLQVRSHSEGYMATWEPPEYGYEMLRIYVLKWFRVNEPLHVLSGTVETRNLYYIVKGLQENEDYIFKVFALSTTDYLASSDSFEIYIVPYKRIIGISVGVSLCILFMAAGVWVYWHLKKKYADKISENNNGIKQTGQ